MPQADWVWRSPPNWPLPPPGCESSGRLAASATLAATPAGLVFWAEPVPPPPPVPDPADWEGEAARVPVVLAPGPRRQNLVWETGS